MWDKFKLYSKMAVVPLLAILISSVWGAISAGKMSEVQCGDLSGYLTKFFSEVPSSGSTVFFGALKKQLIIWFVITVSGGLLPGFLLNICAVCERSFVIGYTFAGFCRVYGLKGIAACVAMLPEMLLYIPILTVFSSISLKMSFLSHENKKVFLGKYILMSIFFLSVFCAVSVFQSFLTTIFMKWISTIL